MHTSTLKLLRISIDRYLIHIFNQQLLLIYCVSGTVLGSGIE